jgi:hypothetical protein
MPCRRTRSRRQRLAAADTVFGAGGHWLIWLMGRAEVAVMLAVLPDPVPVAGRAPSTSQS